LVLSDFSVYFTYILSCFNKDILLLRCKLIPSFISDYYLKCSQCMTVKDDVWSHLRIKFDFDY